jgi:hypothetical protein
VTPIHDALLATVQEHPSRMVNVALPFVSSCGTDTFAGERLAVHAIAPAPPSAVGWMVVAAVGADTGVG